jgi:gluconate kinase
MKNIVILFGEMGCGKNYWGERFAQDLGYQFFDGDTAATPEMVERVVKFKPITREMIIRFVNHLAEEIADRAEKTTGLVVAQALYFDEDRKFLKLFLSSLGYNVVFKWIRPSFWRNLKQIYSRKNGLKWALYLILNKPFFQKPTHEYDLIDFQGR